MQARTRCMKCFRLTCKDASNAIKECKRIVTRLKGPQYYGSEVNYRILRWIDCKPTTHGAERVIDIINKERQ